MGVKRGLLLPGKNRDCAWEQTVEEMSLKQIQHAEDNI
jgi:hypothetical protein